MNNYNIIIKVYTAIIYHMILLTSLTICIRWLDEHETTTEVILLPYRRASLHLYHCHPVRDLLPVRV